MSPRLIYDIETYPNCFTFTAVLEEIPWLVITFEISTRKHEGRALAEFMRKLREAGFQMVGFNNLNFDYPVIHRLVMAGGMLTEAQIYQLAMTIIRANSDDNDDDKFAYSVRPGDRVVPQIDLFKIHHFDNKARMTSLKVIEFNMRAKTIQDLPFPVGTRLNDRQMDELLAYNLHDVLNTRGFLAETQGMIEFREQLCAQHGRKKDWLNFSDVKIGKELFQMRLEDAGISCYEYGENGRQPRQTRRDVIHLGECIPAYLRLETPEFSAIANWLSKQSIRETKGVFTNLVTEYKGLNYKFGTGGIHASVSNGSFVSDHEWMIVDIDVAGMYPSIAIANEYYPEHLGPKFVEVYREVVRERSKYPKGTPQNAALKLAGNGVYGASSDPFSVFFDPRFTMRITLTGQLSIAMLIEQLTKIAGLGIIQANTDGITCQVRRSDIGRFNEITEQWEKLTGLTLERAIYNRMFVADVNSYLAEYEGGKVKRIGRYDHKDLGWNQDHSALVVPKVAEMVLLHGAPIRETIENWPNKLDFMLRIKVPRSSRLVLDRGNGMGIIEQIQNTTRYYVARGGFEMIKIMPPLAKEPTHWRHFRQQAGWRVCVANDLDDATLPIDHDYYVKEVEKLTLVMR
jgi:hypothetical protein